MSRQGHLSNQETQARERSREKMHERQYMEDLRAVLESEHGRRVVWRIINDHGRMFVESYTGNSRTDFNEGRRYVGIHLTAECQKASPAGYIEMLTERLQSIAEDAIHRNDARLKAVTGDE